MKILEDSIVILYPHHYTQDMHERMFRENHKSVGSHPSIQLSIGDNSTVFVKMTISPSSIYSKVRLDKQLQPSKIYVRKSRSYISCLATYQSFPNL